MPTSPGGPCWNCHGAGVIYEYARTPACPICGGTGRILSAEESAAHERREQERAAEHQRALDELRALRGRGASA
jgi:hypothetical protein